MFKFAFGLTSGIVVGVVGSFIAAVFTLIVVEDSPNLQDLLKDISNPQ